MKHYTGLDVSNNTTAICVVDEKGKIVFEREVATDPVAIGKVLGKTGLEFELIGLEAGALSRWLTVELRKGGLPVICADARRMAPFLAVRRNKTDKNDARAIANVMRTGDYQEIHLRSDTAVEVNMVLRMRKTLVQQRTTTKNAIRGQLKAYGIRLGTAGNGIFVKRVRHYLDRFGDLVKLALEALLDAYEKIHERVKEITKKLEVIARSNPVACCLRTMPGIGPITALNFIHEVDDPSRFKKSRTVGAYFGMTPTQYSSGESVRYGGISHWGSAHMRALLIEAAITMLTRTKRWSKLKSWGLKLMRKKGCKKAAVAVARKMSVIMHKMLVTGEDFQYGDLKEAA